MAEPIILRQLDILGKRIVLQYRPETSSKPLYLSVVLIAQNGKSGSTIFYRHGKDAEVMDELFTDVSSMFQLEQELSKHYIKDKITVEALIEGYIHDQGDLEMGDGKLEGLDISIEQAKKVLVDFAMYVRVDEKDNERGIV